MESMKYGMDCDGDEMLI